MRRYCWKLVKQKIQIYKFYWKLWSRNMVTTVGRLPQAFFAQHVSTFPWTNSSANMSSYSGHSKLYFSTSSYAMFLLSSYYFKGAAVVNEEIKALTTLKRNTWWFSSMLWISLLYELQKLLHFVTKQMSSWYELWSYCCFGDFPV